MEVNENGKVMLTKEEAVLLFKAAGYTLTFDGQCATLFTFPNKHARGYSCGAVLLDLKYTIKEIQEMATQKGVEAGKEKVKKEFRTLMGIEEEEA